MTGHHRDATNLYGEIRLYGGTSTPDLAQEISDYLQTPLGGRDKHVKALEVNSVTILLMSAIWFQSVLGASVRCLMWH